MAKKLKSKNNDKFFEVIPKPNEDKKTYNEYKRLVDKISILKSNLSKKNIVLASVNTKYQNYLEANPYKKERKYLQKEVDKLREELINLIPEKF